ncbi:MAG: gas vesicle protein [Desulfosporosinus sp.]|nr:gas vesicle protein [Desulfosporosinus sp.]
MAIQHSNNSSGLGDLLERILDKGIVIAGDIKISLADVELINIKIRLLVASVDKAKEMGIDWWANDPYLSSRARIPEQAITENKEPVQTQSPDEVAEPSPMAEEEKEVIKRPRYRN